MKKASFSFVALILLAAMIIPLLAGCGTGTEESSLVSDDASGTVSGEEERIPVENPQLATVVSLGKSYKTSVPADEKYPDVYSSELTNGITAPTGSNEYTNSAYAGFSSRGYHNITIDLGDVQERIYKVTLGYLSTEDAGIAPPKKVKVQISDNGRKFRDVGVMVIPEYVYGDRLEAVFESEYYLNTRYLRVVIENANSWIFLDEISVIADTEAVASPDDKYSDLIKEAYDKLGTVSYTSNGEAVSGDYLKLVSQGCEYTSDGTALPGYLDKGKYLTDGSDLKVYGQGNWTGYKSEEVPVSITVDLGEVNQKLCEFRVTCYASNSTERFMPVAVTYSISTDGNSYTDIGRVFGVFSGQSVYDYPLMLDNVVSARYVKFTLEATPGKGFILEETSVFACSEMEDRANWFDEPLKFTTETTPFENVSTKKVNLISGKPQQIFIPEHITGVKSDKISTPDTPVLTDGRKATANDIHNGQFFRFQSSSATLEIYYDLGDVAAVSEFTAQFTHHMPWGVQSPYKIFVYLSDDSELWYSAGSADVNPASDECLVDVSLKLKKPVAARYICFYMATCNWIGIGELEAWGTTSVSGVKSLAESGLPTKEETALGYYKPNEDLLNGAKDLCLLYHSKNHDGYNEQTLLPYLAYVDTEGVMQDVMFDSFLFLLSGGFPSGTGGSQGYTQSDMEWVINDLFTEGENILALEETAGKVKAELGLDKDFKYGLAIAVYQAYPGDPDLQKRINAIKDQIAMFEERFNQYEFKNIELVAYYWFDEGVYDENNEVKLVQTISDHVHDKGLDFIWIPWYGASGVDSWQDHGFDVACMQPGYVFKEEVLDTRMETAADMARYFGMGIEIEIGYNSLTNAKLYQRYLEYLSAGAKYGYITDCVHMYYQEITIYHTAATSKDEKIRQLYDYTYMFIKGTLPANPEALETVKVEGKSGEIITGTLMTEVGAGYTFDIASSAEGGTVTLANNGTFAFFPDKDFKGATSFTYTYNVGLGDSKVCTVEIEVK